MKQLGLYLMNEKGLKVLTELIDHIEAPCISYVVSAENTSIKKDYYAEIRALCEQGNIRFWDRKESKSLNEVDYKIAVGWRFLIHDYANLIVFHDSLLPRYRGFSPLVNALINGEPEVGVTALFANKSFDRGDVIEQKKIAITYPITIQEAITAVGELYGQLAVQIVKGIQDGQGLVAAPQNERKASYSLWRDEEDYRIDWTEDSERIRRLVDAVGFPYNGASSYVNGERITILAGETLPDLYIENRTPGKVLFLEEGQPVVVCGRGLFRISHMKDAHQIDFVLKKFRTRFL